MKLLTLFLIVTSFLITGCQTTKPMKIDEILLPPQATAGDIDGQYEVILDQVSSQIFRDLTQTTGKPTEKILFLAPESEPAEILNFFSGQLLGAGFKKDETIPLNNRHHKLQVWRSPSQAIAVAVIEAGNNAEGKPIKFLLVSLATKA